MVRGKAKLLGQLHSRRCHQVIPNSHPKIEKVLEYQQSPLETKETSRDPQRPGKTHADQQRPLETKVDP